MIGVIALSLSILVILSGLYFLSKTKKDSLGNLYVFSSYSAIVLGGLLFAGTIVGGIMMMSHHQGARHASCYMSGHHGGSSCAKQGSCKMYRSHCNQSNSCSAHGNSCKSKSNCGQNCSHGAQASCDHGKHHRGDKHGKMHEKMMRKYHDQNKDTEVEIEEIEEVEEIN